MIDKLRVTRVMKNILRAQPTALLNNINYSSTSNIEEVMKFYNLGHKTFETDFRSFYSAKLFSDFNYRLLLSRRNKRLSSNSIVYDFY